MKYVQEESLLYGPHIVIFGRDPGAVAAPRACESSQPELAERVGSELIDALVTDSTGLC